MSKNLKASIIINNYNYGRFLSEAIESALNQTYPNTEVIVVDDGSTDNSREIIAAYNDQIIPVLKENGGQASAFNSGLHASRGEIIFFLDADDMLLHTAIEKAVELFEDKDVVKVHWSLWTINELGEQTGQVMPGGELPEGDFRESLIFKGPGADLWSPTSGNAFKRSFIEKVLPIPEKEYRICADAYLFSLAPAYGLIKKIQDPQGFYRVHGQNNYCTKPFEEKLILDLKVFERMCSALTLHLQSQGINPEWKLWIANSWCHKVSETVQEIALFIPEQQSFILVDDNQLGTDNIVAGRKRYPFLEKEGMYNGPPPDDLTAINELERLGKQRAGFIVFAWTAFWWLDYYKEFQNYLRSKYQCVLENERLVVFDLRKEID